MIGWQLSKISIIFSGWSGMKINRKERKVRTQSSQSLNADGILCDLCVYFLCDLCG